MRKIKQPTAMRFRITAPRNRLTGKSSAAQENLRLTGFQSCLPDAILNDGVPMSGESGLGA